MAVAGWSTADTTHGLAKLRYEAPVDPAQTGTLTTVWSVEYEPISALALYHGDAVIAAPGLIQRVQLRDEPPGPIVLDSIALPHPSRATDLAVAEDLAVVTLGADGACVVDLAHQPLRLAGCVHLGHPAVAVAIAGGRAFTALGPAGVAVLDTPSSAPPRVLSRYPAIEARDIAVSRHDTVVVTGGNSGLSVLEVVQPPVHARRGACQWRESPWQPGDP
jgi:hypothetical protein